MRLNGVVVNRFVSTSSERQSLGRGFVGLQNHSDADRVSFRSVQVKEWGSERPRCAGGATRRAPADAFSGARLDGCRWNRIVRYDGGGLHVGGGALHLELTGGDILGARNTGPANLVLQPAPAGAWTIETTVRVPLRSGSQQAGLVAYRNDGDYVKLVAEAAPAARSVSGCSARPGMPSPGTLPRRWRRGRGATPTGYASREPARAIPPSGASNGVSWRRLGSVVNTRLANGAAYGLLALGPGREGRRPTRRSSTFASGGRTDEGGAATAAPPRLRALDRAGLRSDSDSGAAGTRPS